MLDGMRSDLLGGVCRIEAIEGAVAERRELGRRLEIESQMTVRKPHSDAEEPEEPGESG